jgi:hypothetical protein
MEISVKVLWVVIVSADPVARLPDVGCLSEPVAVAKPSVESSDEFCCGMTVIVVVSSAVMGTVNDERLDEIPFDELGTTVTVTLSIFVVVVVDPIFVTLFSWREVSSVVSPPEASAPDTVCVRDTLSVIVCVSLNKPGTVEDEAEPEDNSVAVPGDEVPAER